jgi:P27 family predicted phage terminase small subunit
VTPTDSHHLAMFCPTVTEYIAAAALVARDGLLVAGRDGGLVANPACRVERDRLLMAHRLGADLGLSPVARVSLASLPPLLS